ncbi:MAG: benzoate-coa ligase [Gammaproteobacteria bacterium]|nr:benzoate-coa ligase [Gammaproteobacteria bacterium]
MPRLSSADHSVSPPVLDIPREYNAAYDLIERNLRAGRGEKLAYVDDHESCTYRELAQRVDRCAGALAALGLQPEQRVLLCLQDTIDFPTAFLGSIKAGVVPVAVNTLLTPADYEYMLHDSRACALIVSASLLPVFAEVIPKIPTLKHVIISRGARAGAHSFSDLLARAAGTFDPVATGRDDPCFWLYSSGSTGAPKGTIHVHASLIQTAELYGRPILGLCEHDVVFSAAKLFFAYGLGNALSFPLSVGATTILMAERPTSEAVFARLRKFRPTIFCGVPTLYSSLLASAQAPSPSEMSLRACISAGEALPRDIGERWARQFGVDILDGIGSTEMLHIFLSNRPGDVCYGTTGTAVPGYELRLVDDAGRSVPMGDIGELQVAGPTAAMAYWNNREKSRRTFQGPWTCTGDKYYVNGEDRYVYAGRTDDMLKVGGIYVSPVEVESALISHPAVLEAAVIGREDEGGLVKPLAFVVLQTGVEATPSLAEELKQHVKSRLAPYKYPRWIEFVSELPKTATGKLQRFKLRALAAKPQTSATACAH